MQLLKVKAWLIVYTMLKYGVTSRSFGCNKYLAQLRVATRRVEAAVACRLPHRAGRAEFPHPVPRFQLF